MEIDWKSVEKVLVVRLRSIGDTVLTTPTLLTLREFLPSSKIDILLENWVAPVLDGFDAVDEILTISKSSLDRCRMAFRLRKRNYDVVINLHGGTTAGFLTWFTGAPNRIGYRAYQYSFLYNQRYPSASNYFDREFTHSAEQQIALFGYAGVPVSECPKTRLTVTDAARKSVDEKLRAIFGGAPTAAIAMIHPGAAYETKRLAADKYAVIIDHLESRGMAPMVLLTAGERYIADQIESARGKPIKMLSEMSLPEVTAALSKSALFVGNDSGIAHIAAAVKTPSVVIFGSSNRNHWRPWTDSPYRVIFSQYDCQPCPGDFCREYGEPRCIQDVRADQVIAGIDQITAAMAL